MPKIFVHALEGPPQSPGSTESTERDIRISWLIGRPGGPRPWSVSSKSWIASVPPSRDTSMRFISSLFRTVTLSQIS